VSPELLSVLTVFVLAILVGFEVISKVPATLHTPLMSGANSIHGIVLVGAMFIAASAREPLSQILAFVAVVFAAMNVVGGYVVTDRMLQMFKRRPAPGAAPSGAAEVPVPTGSTGSAGPAAGSSGSAGPAAGATESPGGPQA
jgi:NAD(P) transhydrogenase subunit alpha